MSALERCERALARIAEDARLNAWAFIARDDALAAAREHDLRRVAHRLHGPLDGQLVAIKGNIAVAGWPHEGGLGVRRGLRATADAPIVARLRAAGAILLGLTTMDEGALGAEGMALTGPIHHPRALGRSIGGSSGGSAVAVAAGHCDWALGSDTIGSVRIPAALTGIVGFKPSPGRLSTDGVIPVHPDFDHVGLLGATLDALLAVRIVLDDAPPRPRTPHRARVGIIRVGIIEDLATVGVSREVERAYRTTLNDLERIGVELVRVALAPLEPGRLRRAIFALAEHAMWRQHRDESQRRPQDYSSRLTALLRYGSTLSAAKLAELDARIRDFRASWQNATQGLDAVVTPTTPVMAFPHDSPPATLADLTALATAAGAPALSVPATLVEAQDEIPHPVGLQWIGSPGEDDHLCQLVAELMSRPDHPSESDGSPAK